MFREEIANLCHKQWSSWMEYLFSKGVSNNNGSWTIPSEFVERWTRQMNTSYTSLSEPEKDSDRKEADKFIHFLTKNAITSHGSRLKSENT